MQNVCDGGYIKHGSDFTCVCGDGHTVDPDELFAIRQNNKNGQPYGIQFAPMNCLLLGKATETVSQIKVCVIHGIRFSQMNCF